MEGWEERAGQLWGRGVTCLSYFGDASAAAAAYKQREVEAGLKRVASGSGRAPRLLPCGKRLPGSGAAPYSPSGTPAALTWHHGPACLPLARTPWHRAGQGYLWGLLGRGLSLTGRGHRQIRERLPERGPGQPRLSCSSEAGTDPLCPRGLRLGTGHSRCPGAAAFTSDEGQVGEQLQLPADIQLEVAEGGVGRRTEALQRIGGPEDPAAQERGDVTVPPRAPEGPDPPGSPVPAAQHLLCSCLAAWTKQGWSVSFSTSWA